MQKLFPPFATTYPIGRSGIPFVLPMSGTFAANGAWNSGAQLTGSVTLPQATININSSAVLPASGTVNIGGQVVTYTGNTGNQLTGCAGGTGTFGAGTFVGGASLPSAYSDCYLYFPAGAVYAGSVAGWYYVKMGSVYYGTVYNNLYTSGEPQIPTTPTPIVAAGPGAYAQTTGAEITAHSFTLTGKSLGDNGQLLTSGQLSWANTANNKTARVALGNSGCMTFGATFTGTGGTKFMSFLQNRGAENKQASLINLSSGLGAVSSGLTETAIDTTIDQPVFTTMQLSTATDFIVFETLTAQVVPS